jgi:hypothetical protein
MGGFFKKMKWSKLRKKFKEFITPELKERIDVHMTCYHEAHDDYGEAWITLDGKKIFGGGYYHLYVTPIPTDSLNDFSIQHAFHEDFYNVQIKSKKVEEIMKHGVHETSHITNNIWNYINTPYEEALSSNNPIYKAFSLIDRRLGKRRFDKIQLNEFEHPLVIIFYYLRKQCIDEK